MKILGMTIALSLAVQGAQISDATVKSLSKALPSLNSNEVGAVLLQIENHRYYQSGFFVGPNLFITAQSPLRDDRTGYFCDGKNKTLIFSGALQYDPNFDLDNVTPSHTCTKAEGNSDYGWVALHVTPNDKKTVRKGLPLITREWAKKKRFVFDHKELFVVGYGHGKTGLSLKLSQGCELGREIDPFDDDELKNLQGLEAASASWASMECDFQTGMKGSPIFARHRVRREGYFDMVVGIVVGQAQSQKKKVLLFPRIEELVRLFPNYFKGVQS